MTQKKDEIIEKKISPFYKSQYHYKQPKREKPKIDLSIVQKSFLSAEEMLRSMQYSLFTYNDEDILELKKSRKTGSPTGVPSTPTSTPGTPTTPQGPGTAESGAKDPEKP